LSGPRPAGDDDAGPTLRRGFPLAFWLALGFCAACVAAGAAVAWLGPHWG
jgi:hypothetical protein